MKKTNNNRISNVTNTVKSIKKFMIFLMTASLLLNMAELTEYFFFVPLFVLFVILDLIQHKLEKNQQELEEVKNQQERIKKLLSKENELKAIKNFSICLSLDYRNNNQSITESRKTSINKIVFSKFKNCVSKLPLSLSLNINSVLILTSPDFLNYDLIYGCLINFLEKNKKIIKDKLNLNMIPSITTDAYFNSHIALDEIKRRHYQIQKCINNKNSSCSTSLFAKKYKYLNRSAYQGTCMGEYVTNDDEFYELNLINSKLDKI